MDGAAARDRLHAVDHIKAAAIVAVVVIHAGRAGWPPRVETPDYFLTLLWTQFGVPAFLFASGLLYARTEPVDLRHVGSRLARVLLPYLLASCAAQLLGFTRARDLGDVLFQLATASSLGIYYYVFLVALCIPLIWPLSRASRRTLGFLWLATLLWTLALVAQPSLRLPPPMWDARIPTEGFMLGYFLTGWLAGAWRDELGRFHTRHPTFSLVGPGAAALFGLLVFGGVLPPSPQPFDRVIYTFGVIGLIATLTHARPAGPVVRFLGDASLGLFLYHRIFQLLAQPYTRDWPDLLRIAAQVSVGLAGASLLILAARRTLGPERARRFFGG